MKKLEQISADLFNKIRGRFENVTIGDQEGKVTNVPEDARYFDFAYLADGVDLGKVSVALDPDQGLSVIVGRDLVQGQMEDVQDGWYNFLKELRVFAKKRMMKFEVRDINKSNLNKRDYEFLAQNRNGENTMAESKMYGNDRTSFQKIGKAKLAIKHSAPINLENASSRTSKISKIFIESPEGEKFKFPYKHLAGARALAHHISEGGHAYDDFGKYITSLSEEMHKIRKLNTYMGRSSVMAETLDQYSDVLKQRVSEVRKEISNLQKPAYYAEAVENFVAVEAVEVPDEIAENWIDQLTIKQFNEELKDVFPYVYKLVGEATKAQELDFDDVVAEVAGPKDCWDGYKKAGTQPGTGKNKGKRVNKCVPESIDDMLEAAIESMMGQFAEDKDGRIDTRHWHSDDEYDPAYDDDEDEDDTDEAGNSIEEPKEQKTPIGEFILSYFDRENGTFPKGETAVLTMVEKDYGEQYVEPAARFIQKVESMVAERNAEQVELSRYPETDRIKSLAGL
jgi:NTP pyrophosphatase (non-canonical NTP hydrolase)